MIALQVRRFNGLLARYSAITDIEGFTWAFMQFSVGAFLFFDFFSLKENRNPVKIYTHLSLVFVLRADGTIGKTSY